MFFLQLLKILYTFCQIVFIIFLFYTEDACDILTSSHAFKAPKKRTDTQIRQDEHKHNLPHCDVKITRLCQKNVDKYARNDSEKEEKDNGKDKSKSTVDINVVREKTGVVSEISPIKNDLFNNLSQESSVSSKDDDDNASLSIVKQHGTSQNKICKKGKYGKKRRTKLRQAKQEGKEDDRSFVKHELTEDLDGKNERTVEDKGDVSDDDCVIVEKEVEVISLLNSDGEDGNSDSDRIVCRADTTNGNTASCVDNHDSSAHNVESNQSSPESSHNSGQSKTKSCESVAKSESGVCSSPESGNNSEESRNNSCDVTVDSKSEIKQMDDGGIFGKDTGKGDADSDEKSIGTIKDIDIKHSINHDVFPYKQKHKCVEPDSNQSDDEKKIFDTAFHDLLQLERKVVNASKYQENEDRLNYGTMSGKVLERKDEECKKEKVDSDTDSDHSIDNDKIVIDNALKDLMQLEEMISQGSPSSRRMSPVLLTDLSSTNTKENGSLRINSSKLLDRDSTHIEASSCNAKFKEGTSVQDSKSDSICRSKTVVSEGDVCPADHSDMALETEEHLAESELASDSPNIEKCQSYTKVAITGNLNNSLVCQDKITEHSELAGQDKNTDNGKIDDKLCSVKERIIIHLMKGFKGDAEESEKKEVNVKKNNCNTINTAKPDVHKQEEVPVNEFLSKVMNMIEDTSTTKTEDKIGNDVKFAADKHFTVHQDRDAFKMCTIQGGVNIEDKTFTDIKSEEKNKCITNGMKSDSDTSIGYIKHETVISKGLTLGLKDKTKKEPVAMLVGDEMIHIELANDSSDGETDAANTTNDSNMESASDTEKCTQTGYAPVIHSSVTGNVNTKTLEAKPKQSPAEHGLVKVSNNMQGKVLEFLNDKKLKDQKAQNTKEAAKSMHAPNSSVGHSVNMQNILVWAPNNNCNGPAKKKKSHSVGQPAPLISVSNQSQPSCLLRSIYVPQVSLLSNSNSISHASIPQPLTINPKPTDPVVSTGATVLKFPVFSKFGMMLTTPVQAQPPALPYVSTAMPRIVYAPRPTAPLINVQHAVLTNSRGVAAKALNVKILPPANNSVKTLNTALNTAKPNEVKQNSIRNTDSAKSILPDLTKKNAPITMKIVIGKDGVHYKTETRKPYFPNPDKKMFVVAGPQGKFYDKATGFEVNVPNSASLIHTPGAVYHITGATLSERVVRELAGKQWKIKQSTTSDIKQSTTSDIKGKKPKSKKKRAVVEMCSSDEEFEKLLESESEKSVKSGAEESDDPDYDYEKISQRVKAAREKKVRTSFRNWC